MDKIVIDKTRGETLRCHFKVEGASISDTIIRLCLELNGNKNMFFNGTLEENGDCVIHIPKLQEFEPQNGKLTIEAIVDSVYFKLYEAGVELSQPVSVQVVRPPVAQETTPPKQIKLEGLQVSTPPAPKKAKPAPPPTKPVVEVTEPPEEMPPAKEGKPKLKTFYQWKKNR